MAPKNHGHIFDVEMGKHKPGCLCRHITPFEKDNSCSHRWQAYKNAEDNPFIFNGLAYASLVGKTKWKHPQQYGDWDIGKSSKIYRTINGAKTPINVNNFEERADVPFKFNSHHLIPNSVLNNCLTEAAERDMRILYITRSALLEAEYNLNDKSNMIILPIPRYVAEGYGLPRHISGIDSLPGEKPEKMNHSDYNNNVKKLVSKIIESFTNALRIEECDVEAGSFARSTLETISDMIYTKLITWRGLNKGLAINSLPDL